jgi:WD40 repeat protein
MSDMPPNSTAPPLPPPRVPDHELLRRIGRGAYGEVWLARCAIGAYRAVKIVHRASFDHDRPFEREFEGILKFEPVSRTHDSQVDILHVGRSEDCFYYVMELADDQATGGQINPDHYTPRTLKSDLQFHGRLPFEECVRIGIALTTALEHLHENGLVHRDVKPSNIIFVNGVPKLADIGLVTGVDATHTYVGTEGFTAPEGSGTAQADLYSLGKVLYEAATGKDRQEFPELPTLLRELPDREGLMELNAVIARACRHDPKDRYDSADAMRADLELLQSGKSLARLYRTEKQLRFVQRAGAVVTAVAALIGVGWLWQAHETHLVHDLANTNARLAGENRQRVVRLDVANGVRLLDEGDPAGALLWFADALPQVTNSLPEESIHRIRVQQTLNQMPRLAQALAHEYPVRAMAFSPDGKRFATGTEWGRLQVWDAQTGAPLWQPLHLDGETVGQLGFTEDGQRLLVSTWPGRESGRNRTNTAAVIDVPSGKPLFTKTATNLIKAEFAPEGRWLATVASDHVIRLLGVHDGSEVAVLKGHTDDIVAFSFNASGDLLASTSQDGTIRLWRLPAGEPVGSPIPYEPGKHPAMVSQRGERLATCEPVVRDRSTNTVINTLIRIWDTKTGASIGHPIELSDDLGAMSFDSAAGRQLHVLSRRCVRVFDADKQTDLLRTIQFDRPAGNWCATADGRRMIVAGPEGVAGLWSLETGEALAPPLQHGRQIVDLAFNRDGSQLATTSDEGACVLWNMNLRQEDAIHIFDANIERRAPQTLLYRFSPDRRRFLIILMDHTVRLVDTERMAEVELPGPKPTNCAPHQCIFAPDSRQWAIAYAGSKVRLAELWRDEAGVLRRLILLHPKGIGAMRFTPDGSRLITRSDDRLIRSWRTDDGTLEQTIAMPESLEDGEIFPDGRTIFFVEHGNHGFVLFDLATGASVRTAIPPVNITAFAFDPLGERFATVTEEQWGRIWSSRTGQPLTPPVWHGGPLTWVDWSPDGTRILMSGTTPEAKVWDAATGDLLLPALRIGDEPIVTAMWSLDRRFIVARSDKDAARVWDAATGEAVTPLLKHSTYLRLAHLVANNRLITISLPNKLRAWDLKESHLAPDVLADYARLASGRRLNAGGVMVPLKPTELADLCRSLHARAPELFRQE